MQSDASNVQDQLNMDLSPTELSEVNAANAESATAAAAEAARVAVPAAVVPTPDATANALTAALESSNRIAAEALARQSAADAAANAAAAAEKATADAAALAEANKAPDWDALKAELRQKRDAGELDEDEYEVENEKLADQRADWRGAAAARTEHARIQQEEAARRQTAAVADQEAQWNTAYSAFEKDPGNAVILQDATRARAFNAELQAIGEANPSMSYADMLVLTRNNVLKAFSIQQSTAQRDADAIAAEQRRREREAGRVPTDLNGLPNAGQDVIIGGKYAHLDGLDIDALENAIARMSEADQRAFLLDAPGSNTRGHLEK